MAYSILRKNLIFSLTFGICMGLVFPLYSLLFVNFKSKLMMIFFIAGCIIAGLLVGIFAYLINNGTIVKMAKRISSVIISIKKKEQTDFTQLTINSDDVLGLLIDNFRDGLEVFDKTLNLLKNTSQEALEMSRNIESNLGTTTDSIRVLFSTIQLLEDAAQELDRQNNIMEKGYELLNKSTLLNVSNVIELYSNINEFGKTIFNQSESLKVLILGLSAIEIQIKDDNENNENTLAVLSDDLDMKVKNTINTSLSLFNSIKQNLNSIDGIAERTNILSINAAIEAARLGKEGAGFRIIAQNIKQLAGEVHLLTEKIASEMTVGEHELHKTTKILGNALKLQRTIIDEIKSSILTLTDKNIDVSNLMNSMIENKDQIDNLLRDIKMNMQNLKNFVSETKDSLQLVVNTSLILHSGIGTLSEKSKNINESEEMTKQSLQIFKRQIVELGLQLK